MSTTPRCSERAKSSGKRCKRTALIGTDPPVCVSHTGAVGRKSALTDQVTEDLSKLLSAGNYVEVALAVVGVPRSTFYDWMTHGDPEGADSRDRPYRDFRVRIDEARAEGEARNVGVVASAAKEDWKAAAWMLERQFPERWGRVPPESRSNDAASGKDTNSAGEPRGEVDPFAALEGDQVAQQRAKRRSSG